MELRIQKEFCATSGSKIHLPLLANIQQTALAACNADIRSPSERKPFKNFEDTANADRMKIKITTGKKVIQAPLYDSPASRDFISLLPLDLILDDYNSTEKISNLPKKLSTKNAPTGYKPSAGDITFYSPWGNLAIFYKNFSYSTGLIPLGKIDSGIDVLNMSGSLAVKIELVE